MFSLNTLPLQLCWMIFLVTSCTQGQLIEGDASVAETNGPALVSEAVLDLEDTVTERLDDLLARNYIENAWGAPVVASWHGKDTQPTPAMSTLRHAIPSPESTAAPRTLGVDASSAGSQIVLPVSTLVQTITSPESSFVVSVTTAFSTRSTTSTVTVMTTVWVSPTPPTLPLEDSSPVATEDAAPEPTTTTVPATMTAMAQVGMGIGITFGAMSLAGVAGLYLWRRRRNSHDSNGSDNDSDKADYRDRLAKVFSFKRQKDNKDDAEWSIESAEKVSIVKNMRAQSVQTVSRSNSRGSDNSDHIGVIPIAMRGRNMTVALSSHPMTPSYTGFVVKPSEANTEIPKMDPVQRELKPSGWPLKK